MASNFDDSDETYSYNIPQVTDFSREYEYFDATDNFVDDFFAPTGSNNLKNRRKSMSVGNLIMFTEEQTENILKIREELGTNQSNSSSKNDSNSDSEEKEEEHQWTVEDEKNLNKKGPNSCRNGNPSYFKKVPQKISMDHLNKLAQPKCYSSMDHLNQGSSKKYVSTAEAVYQFQNRTPIRFKSKPKLLNFHPLPQHLKCTIPHSPALQTKTRNRPPLDIMTQEEKELMEFEKIRKLTIKANPVNKNILNGPLKTSVPIERKPVTKPEPFKLTQVPPKKVVQEKKFVFQAQPIPKTIENPPKLPKFEKRLPTKAVTPQFMKNYKGPTVTKVEETVTNVQTKCCERPTNTKPAPFSFEERDKMVLRKRKQLIQKVMDEERRAREFHAKPVPKSLYKKSNSFKTDCGSSVSSSRKHSSNDNLCPQFKARPPSVLYKEPFVPSKAEKSVTQVVPFQLETDQRRLERKEFERKLQLNQEKLEQYNKILETKRMEKEKEEIAKLRRQTEYKANPIRKYKEFEIQHTVQITIPISPKFHTTKTDKENIPANKQIKKNSI